MDVIRNQGKLPVPSFIYYFARAMYHFKSETFQDSFFVDLVDSVHTHMSDTMTYQFVDIYEFFVELIATIHYETKYLRYLGKKDEKQQVIDQVVTTNKYELFSQGLMVEDSLLNGCFSGKFVIVNKCLKCEQVHFSAEDFLSLNIDVFTTSDAEHIKNLRKEYSIGSEQKEKKKGAWGVFKSLNPFSSSLKEVTLLDYMNNMFNHSLVKKNESYQCTTCNDHTLADKIYKINSLPNNLLVTMIYKNNTDISKYLKLKNFMEIDMTPFVVNRFYNYGMNPFHLEKDSQFKYTLQSLIVYSTNEPTKDGYITYSRQPEGTWLRFSKYSTKYVDASEIEEIKYPYILIYKRDFEMGNERSNIRSQLEILPLTGYRSEMKPIPDFWMQKAVYLHSPGKIYLAHLVCQHFKLKPNFKDVYVRPRKTYYLTEAEEELFQQE